VISKAQNTENSILRLRPESQEKLGRDEVASGQEGGSDWLQFVRLLAFDIDLDNRLLTRYLLSGPVKAMETVRNDRTGMRYFSSQPVHYFFSFVLECPLHALLALTTGVVLFLSRVCQLHDVLAWWISRPCRSTQLSQLGTIQGREMHHATDGRTQPPSIFTQRAIYAWLSVKSGR
jgi:hypothetical protein